jgi:P-type Ca2+ transporter type 2C
VLEAVHECREAGIKVVMITGDYAGTAQAIAQEAGLDARAPMTGSEIERLDDRELAEHVKSVTVFAHVVPEQKLRVGQCLQGRGRGCGDDRRWR